jgi:hypothetical protein
MTTRSERCASADVGLWLKWSLATRAEPPEPALRSFLDTLRAHHPRASTYAKRGNRPSR